MPIHDWSRVDHGVFHDFHQAWTIEIRDALNGGGLPAGYFAMAEQVLSGPIPDVVTLQQHYAHKANRILVKHRLGRTVAVIEIVSPGNKSSRHALRSFVQKAAELLREGVNLLVVDLFPTWAAVLFLLGGLALVFSSGDAAINNVASIVQIDILDNYLGLSLSRRQNLYVSFALQIGLGVIGVIGALAFESILDLLYSLWKEGTGRTVVLATHDSAIAETAPRLLQLDDGCLAGERGQRPAPTAVAERGQA
jgi:hypothetical protein